MTYPKDDLGNVQVDFAWGNFPPQPDELRDGNEFSFGGGSGDHGWGAAYSADSTTLSTSISASVNNPSQAFDVPNNHAAYTTGYQNFPAYIPDYAGDGDSDLEVVLPQLLRLNRAAAQNAADAAGLGTLDISYTNYDLEHVTSAAKVVTVTVTDDHLLAVGDTVSVVYNDGDGFAGTWEGIKITAVPGARTFQFKLGTAPNPVLDFASTGYVFNNAGIVLAVDGAAGDIVNKGANIPVLVLNGD